MHEDDEKTSGEAPAPTGVPGDHAPRQRSEDQRPTEVGGRDGPEPTRYGDWEKNGRCIDF